MAALVIFSLGCSSADDDFDGLYRVASLTSHEGSCAAPGTDVEPEYPKFRVTEREWLGATIYPVYPCDDAGVCDEDNDGTWNLVVVEDDLDQVSSTMTFNDGDACVLNSVDLVIDRVDGNVVLQQRTNQARIPYDPSSCTTDRAKAMRGDMQCTQMLQLVGAPDGGAAG
jgi:hypothetical protein